MTETATKWKCLSWTAEEDEVLLRAWQEWNGPSGQARKGFLKEAIKLLPHRTYTAIRHRLSSYVKSGKALRQWKRAIYRSLSLSPTQTAWLAGIFDGEGSLGMSKYMDTRSKRVYRSKALRVTLIYNNDEELLSRVHRLVPFAKRYRNGKAGTDSRGIVTRKDIFSLTVYGQKQILQVLRALLPYMGHGAKRDKSLELIAYIKERQKNVG